MDKMDKRKPAPASRMIVIVLYLAMVAVNALANILPINGITTGERSDSYPNLFAPAGLTFSIWGLIYLLLALYCLYQAGLFRSEEWPVSGNLMSEINFFFGLSSLVNIGWVFAWHYDQIAISLILMLVLLGTLIRITRLTSSVMLSAKENFFLRLPFSVYFGWITVATIANVTTWLVSAEWDAFGLGEDIWTVIVLAVGLLILMVTTIRDTDWAYGLTGSWAYLGILLKHLDADGHGGQYPVIIATAAAGMVLLLLAGIFAGYRQWHMNRVS